MSTPTPTPATGAAEPWHLDKKVPLALMAMILTQTAGMAWWASEMASTVREHNRRLQLMELADQHASRDFNALKADVAVLVAQQTATLRSLDRVERLLDSGRTNGGR